MKAYGMLRRGAALLLLAALLCSALPAVADEYYFGEQGMDIFDGAYRLTVDKHWTLEMDYEIPSKLHVHDRFWTWKQWCVKDNHNQKAIRFFKETYPFTYENELSNEFLMKTFARLVAHLRPAQYTVKVLAKDKDGNVIKDTNGEDLYVDEIRQYKDYVSHPIKVGEWQALQLSGFQYNAVVVLTGEDILYFASQHLTLEELTKIMKTLEPGSVVTDDFE